MNNLERKQVFVLDTNVLIGFSLWLPINVNTGFWRVLTDSLRKGEWVLLDAVVREIKYNSELEKWCKEQGKAGLVKNITDVNKARAVEINNQYKMIDETTQKSTVDTYLIAYAEANSLVVFSREGPKGNGDVLYKIPDVCDKLKIKRIRKPEDFMVAIGYKA